VRKHILITLAGLLVISAFFYIFSKKTMLNLSTDLSKQEELLQSYQRESDTVPGELAITRLKRTNALNELELKKLQSIFDSRKKDMPGDVSDIGIYFFESLYATTKTLERKATAKKMILPPINFPVDIPEQEEVTFLLKQVEIVDDVLSMIIDTGNSEVEAIQPQVVDKDNSIFGFIKLGLQITMRLDANSLVKVLANLNSHIPLYIIEELTVKSLDQNRLRTSFTISRILTDSVLADLVEFQGKDINDLNMIYPLDMDFKSFSKRNPFFRYKGEVKQTFVSAQTKQIPTKPQFTYKGTILMNGKLVGIIEDNWQESICFAEAGDICSEYEVLYIKAKKAALFKDDQEVVLMKGAGNE